jgi:hypothetical protein
MQAWRVAWVAGWLVLAGAAPGAAQLGAIEALLRNVTDVSFYAGSGVLFPKPDLLDESEHGLSAYGVELLFEIGAVRRARPSNSPPSPDSVTLVWTGMEVRRSDGRADTVYTYQPRPVARSVAYDTAWTFELGVGYGQTAGFEAADPDTELRGSVRDLPAVTAYASYETIGAYFGMRTGFMRTQALQVSTPDGTTWRGSAEAFLLGAVLGQAFEISGITAFVEAGYMIRHFPSVQWDGPAPLPAIVKRDLRLSGFVASIGIQFGLGN